jgi:hypothetical protein
MNLGNSERKLNHLCEIMRLTAIITKERFEMALSFKRITTEQAV